MASRLQRVARGSGRRRGVPKEDAPDSDARHYERAKETVRLLEQALEGKKTRKERDEVLESVGFVETSVEDWLGLTQADWDEIEIRNNLRAYVRQLREENHVTQKELAHRLGSSQSRVAKIEAGGPSVSLDLLVRAILALGATRQQLAMAIAAP